MKVVLRVVLSLREWRKRSQLLCVFDQNKLPGEGLVNVIQCLLILRAGPSTVRPVGTLD